MRGHSAAVPSILRAITSRIDSTPLSLLACHLEPAYSVLPRLTTTPSAPLSTSASAGASAFVPQHHADTPLPPLPKIINLPQLSSAMESEFHARRYQEVLRLYNAGDSRILLPLSKSNPRAAAVAYDCALKACAAAAESRQAQRIVSTMWKRGVPVGRVAQGSLLKALCSAGQRSYAFQHLKGIPASRLTTMHCNTVLSACATAHDTALGLKVWEFMQRRGVEVDKVTWCEALRLMGAAGDVEGVKRIWKEACTAMSAMDDNPPQGSLLTSTAEEMHQREESRAMVAAAYAGALAAAGDIPGAMDACQQLMDSLSHLLPEDLEAFVAEKNLQRKKGGDNEDISNNLSHNDSREEKMTTNRGVGDRKKSEGRRLGAAPLDHLRSACNAVLYAALGAQEWGSMRKLVALMTARGLPPDVITYNALLKAALKRGEGPQPLLEGMTEMRALGLHPSIGTFNLLIEAYAAEGDIDGAQSTFESLKKEGIKPDATTWNALLKSHAHIGDLSTLGQTFQLMVDQAAVGVGPVPEDSTYAVCFEGIAATARRHGESTTSSHTGGGGAGGGTAGSGENLIPSASQHTNNNNTSPAREAATALLNRIENEMRERKGGRLGYNSVATAALIKAHGALGHTATVWKLLLEEYGTSKSSNNLKGNKASSSSSQMPNGAKSGSSPLAAKHQAGVSTSPPPPPNLFTPPPSLKSGGSTSTSGSTSKDGARKKEFAPPLSSSAAELELDLLRALHESFAPPPSSQGRVLTPLSSQQQQNNTTTTSQLQSSRLPGPRALNSGIPSLIRAGKVEGVTYLLRLLSFQGTPTVPDADTYAALISACTAPLRPALARKLLTQMNDEGRIKPCAKVYAALLRVECGRGGVPAAAEVIDEMLSAGVVPDAATWAALRGCAQAHGRPDVVEYAQREIRAVQEGGVLKRRSRFEGGEQVAASVVVGAGNGEEGEVVREFEEDDDGVFDNERHWKGYYATDEEDEW